jgi:predicted DsbA family dithiol-disulfide isomerase
LHPEYPPEGISREELHARYSESSRRQLEESFERAGLPYSPPPDVVPNTHLALRVTELARDRGLHEVVHDRLMDAYWNESRNIGEPSTLRELVIEAGLHEDAVDAVLAGEAYAGRVQASTRQAQAFGITGIPAFLLGGKLLVLGALPPDVFERALAQL